MNGKEERKAAMRVFAVVGTLAAGIDLAVSLIEAGQVEAAKIVLRKSKEEAAAMLEERR
jgi:hypothetical protein